MQRRMAARQKVSNFYGAQLPALANRLPVVARRFERHFDFPKAPGIETRIIDASWDWSDRDGTRAVGTVLSMLPASELENLTDAKLAALSPVRPTEPVVARTLPTTKGELLEGVVVQGEIGGYADGAKAWVGRLPESPMLVQVIAAVHGERGYVLPETLDALFEQLIKRAVIDLDGDGLSAMGLVTSRVSLTTGAIMDRSTGSQWQGSAMDGKEFDYLEVPAGLWDIAGYSNQIFGLDAKGRFCFLKSFAKRATFKRKKFSFPGVEGAVPVDLYSTGADTGFALVRDGVVHYARWQGQTIDFVERALATLQFHSPRHQLHKLLDEGPIRFDETRMFSMAPAPFLQPKKNSKKGAR